MAKARSRKGRTAVYLLLVRLGKRDIIYTGISGDIDQRVRAHREGRGALVTKMGRVGPLLYVRWYKTRREAAREEWRIKHHSRKRRLKEWLVWGPVAAVASEVFLRWEL